jgi:hypothetical protein
MDAAPSTATLNGRDRAAQAAFEQYELVFSALLASHARAGRVLDQWEVEDLAASLPEYRKFTALQLEYNAAVGELVSGAKLNELKTKLSTRDGNGGAHLPSSALSSSPLPPPRKSGRSPVKLATPASRRASARQLHLTPPHQSSISHKRRRLLGRMLSVVRYPLLRLRRPGAAVKARDKYVEGADFGHGELRQPTQGSAKPARSAQLAGPA